MATHGPSKHTHGYTPFKKSGWGAATFISVLTAALFLTAFAIHKATYDDPIDPLSPSKGRPVAEHASAAGADHASPADSSGSEHTEPAGGH